MLSDCCAWSAPPLGGGSRAEARLVLRFIGGPASRRRLPFHYYFIEGDDVALVEPDARRVLIKIDIRHWSTLSGADPAGSTGTHLRYIRFVWVERPHNV